MVAHVNFLSYCNPFPIRGQLFCFEESGVKMIRFKFHRNSQFNNVKRNYGKYSRPLTDA